jgi:hypothetical protein
MIAYKSQSLTHLSHFLSVFSSVYDLRTCSLIILLIYTNFTPIIQNGKPNGMAGASHRQIKARKDNFPPPHLPGYDPGPG